jgi:multiple RNA-binding domain-containing protein 1
LQIADKELPKSRRQQRLEKSAPRNDEYIAPLQENALKRKREEAELAQDPKLKEFLQVYQAPSKTNVWTNGDIQTNNAVAAADEATQVVEVPEDESDDDYQVIAKKPKTTDEAPPAINTSAAPATSAPQPNINATSIEPVQNVEDMEGVEEGGEAERGPVSDADWLRSRTNRVLDFVEDDEPSSATSQPQAQATPAPTPTPVQPPIPEYAAQPDEAEQHEAPPEEVPNSAEVEKIRDTGRLYLRNLHYEVTEEELRQHFAKYGSLEEVSVFYFSIYPCNDERQDRDN